MEMQSMIVVLTVLLVVGTGADYVRPPPRKTLHFPWSPKHSSHPQQVKSDSRCFYF